MRVAIFFFSAALILTSTGVTSAVKTSEWPSAPSRLELTTPYGTLHVSHSEYVYESRLLLDNQEIEPQVKGLLNIPYAFSAPDFHIALVSVDTGARVCPVSYTWVVLKENGYSVTPLFGSCSELIRVSTEDSTFSVETPNADDPSKIDLYVYDGNTVTHHDPAAPK